MTTLLDTDRMIALTHRIRKSWSMMRGANLKLIEAKADTCNATDAICKQATLAEACMEYAAAGIQNRAARDKNDTHQSAVTRQKMETALDLIINLLEEEQAHD
jgi:hypothetical protein